MLFIVACQGHDNHGPPGSPVEHLEVTTSAYGIPKTPQLQTMSIPSAVSFMPTLCVAPHVRHLATTRVSLRGDGTENAHVAGPARHKEESLGNPYWGAHRYARVKHAVVMTFSYQSKMSLALTFKQTFTFRSAAE
jgi:hypothetical protein